MVSIAQKFKERVKSSRTEVQSIFLPQRSTDDDDDKSVETMWKDLSSVSSNPCKNCRALQNKLLFESRNSSLREKSYSEEEVKTLRLQLDDAIQRLHEREVKVAELEDSLCRIQEDRVKNEEIRYQRSLLERKQHMGNLEAELKSMEQRMQEASLESDRKIKCMKKRVTTVKQECALKLFEMRQDNNQLLDDNLQLRKQVGRLKHELETCPGNAAESSASNNCQETGRLDSRASRRPVSCTSSDSAVSSHSRCSVVTEPGDNGLAGTRLILDLSERVSSLDEENTMLRQQLDKALLDLERLKNSSSRSDIRRGKTRIHSVPDGSRL